MKAVHVICRKEPPSNKPLGIFPAPGPNQYTSEAWDFSPVEAEALVGGLKRRTACKDTHAVILDRLCR